MEHIEGMLDRDQRTAKTRFFSNGEGAVPQPCRHITTPRTNPVERRFAPAKTRSSRGGSTHLACRNGYLLNTFQSFKHILIVVCITLTVASLPRASTAPAMSTTPDKSQDLFSRKQYWMNPCDEHMVKNVGGDPKEIDTTFFTRIADEAQTALRNARQFKNNFAQKTFNKNIEAVHEDLRGQDLPWLKIELPIKLGETASDDVLKNLKANDFLYDMHKNLQTIAVGLEQITEDQRQLEKDFTEQFKVAESDIKRLLCEVRTAIVEHNLTLPADKTREEVWKAADRNGDISKINFRSWIIFREYMTTVEYVLQAVTHFGKSSAQS